jgi:anti-sigma B factor antagonist
MQITRSHSDESTFALAGRFDAHEVAGFRGALEPSLHEHGTRINLDLTNVIFIDSTALAELVRAMKQARLHDGDVVLVGLSDPVRVILELTRLDRALTIAA